MNRIEHIKTALKVLHYRDDQNNYATAIAKNTENIDLKDILWSLSYVLRYDFTTDKKTQLLNSLKACGFANYRSIAKQVMLHVPFAGFDVESIVFYVQDCRFYTEKCIIIDKDGIPHSIDIYKHIDI